MGVNLNKSKIIQGTLILTLAGILTRFIGFFYKIFLSNAMGAERLGLYQLIFPIYSICFTLYASGIQTAISKLTAEEVGKGRPDHAPRILKHGLILSFATALLLTILLFQNSEWIASRILLESRCAPSLRILSLMFPFCGITACINGYYFGLKRAGVPAATQVIEQTIRVACVFIFALRPNNGDAAVTCELAVFGMLAGELASNLYNLISLFVLKPSKKLPVLAKLSKKRRTLHLLLKTSLPLTSNRLCLSLLHSFETILIPSMLQRSGLSNAAALSIFGILNGMSVPFLLFPSALTNALSVLLLPEISEAQAQNHQIQINRSITLSIKFSLLLGIVSTGIFGFFGDFLGNAVFHEPLAGTYLVGLAWLCPFLYLATTLSSILNGLGKAHVVFLNSTIASVARIIILALLIPSKGILGYFLSLLVSELLITYLDLRAIYKTAPFSFDSINTLLKPGIITVLSGAILYGMYRLLKADTQIPDLILLLCMCALFCIIFIVFLFLTKSVSKNEWKG